VAIAYLRKAARASDKLKYEGMLMMPYHKEASAFFAKAQEEAKDIGIFLAAVQKDNDQIYHERVKDDNEVDGSPAKKMTTSKPFEPPPAEELTIVERGGWSCCIQ